MYRVILKRQAKKQLEKLGKKEQRKIKQAIDFLSADPFSGKKLTGEHKGEYTLRAWPYRIIYTIAKKKVTVFVLAIGHRQGVYK